ncbi:MAG: hypothetical protein GF308_09445 [Candidatus Heimdallarchaeota archaeon]|nr:hypothetical protein [Candidatus Heimdallarchaeota archaeon]
MANPIIFGLVRFLHDLFTVIWIGGLVSMSLVIIPTLRKKVEQNMEREQLMGSMKKKLSILVYISIVGLIITGILLSKRAPDYTRPFGFNNTYSILVSVKHLLMIPMVIIAIGKSLILDRLANQTETLKKIRVLLIFVNLVLGIAVLGLSGFSAAIASAPPVPP